MIQSRRTARAELAADDPAPPEDPSGLGPEQKGLVITHYGRQLEIEATDGAQRGRTFRCHQRANLPSVVPGDRVVWRRGESYGVVEAVLPRSNVLTRPDSSNQLRPSAANIDQIVIVTAPVPAPHANLVDRYLVAAENIPVRPIIVFNKCDLCREAAQREFDDMLAVYRDIGYRVLHTSSKTGAGLDALKEVLGDATSIFAGQSGVGKSALINALMPGVDTLEGALSEAADKGRHTTTSARLFHFPEGGELIDSPGIREFGLGHLGPDELFNGFTEFRPFLGKCRFRDCRHEQEPGCRLREAAEQGEIDPRRLASCLEILHSMPA